MPTDQWYHLPVSNSSRRSSGYSKKLRSKQKLFAKKTRSDRRNSSSFFRSVSSKPRSSANFRNVSSKISSGFKRKAHILTQHYNKPDQILRHHTV
jgi:hypothetical protein|uniref:Uncharacterized protein n=1 Tax=viral metagenome TaxID=1070528 RepID=A0A6C0DIH7_9ZZZZ